MKSNNDFYWIVYCKNDVVIIFLIPQNAYYTIGMVISYLCYIVKYYTNYRMAQNFDGGKF